MSKGYRQTSIYDDYDDYSRGSTSTYYPPAGSAYSRSGSSQKPNTYYSSYYGGWDYYSKYSYAKKNDLIKPHLYYLDETKIESIIKAGFENAELLAICHRHYLNNVNLKDAENRGSTDKFKNRLVEIYRNIPKHLIYDTFKLYYNNVDQLKFEDRTEKEELKYKFLEKLNNPVSKIMTEKSNLKSSIFARNALFQFLTEALEATDEEVQQQSCSSTQMTKFLQDLFSNDPGGAKGTPSQEVKDRVQDKLFNQQSSQEFENELLNNAMEICVEVNKLMDEEAQDKIFNGSDSGGIINANTLQTNSLNTIKQKIKEISLNTDKLRNKLKFLVSKAENHFSSKRKIEYEEFLESDDISGLDEFEYLHPKLKKAFVADIMLRKVIKTGTLNVYADTSGSMSDYIRVKSGADAKTSRRSADSTTIRKINFLKNLIFKFGEMKLLNNLYLFDTVVRDSKKDLITISMIGTSGGTSINACISHAEKQKENAVIVTDAEDTCNTYSDLVYLIGLPGAAFSYFDKDVLRKYVDGDQILIFDGVRTFKVNYDGKPIN